jgi:hypothetical protein
MSRLAMHLDWLWPADTVPGDQDPKAWGRYLWCALYAAAERAEREPALQPEAIALIRTLRDVLPCTACRKCLRATLSRAPPNESTDLRQWLQELEAGITHRAVLQGGQRQVARADRPALEAGEVELAWVLAYCLRGGGGRATSVIAQWSATFDQFVRLLVRLLDPVEGSLLDVMAGKLDLLPSLRYDPYRFLERCVSEQSGRIRVRNAERRASRRAQVRPKGGHPHGPPLGTRPSGSTLSSAAARVTRTKPAKVQPRLGPPVRPVLPRMSKLQQPRALPPVQQVVPPKTQISSSNRGAMQQRIWRKRYPRSGSVH